MIDLTDLRGLATVLCFVGFFAVLFWAYGPSRKQSFDAAAQLPFDDDQTKPDERETVE
jgi:cytochrome c oxidase cbb3-type subunit 4